MARHEVIADNQPADEETPTLTDDERLALAEEVDEIIRQELEDRAVGRSSPPGR